MKVTYNWLKEFVDFNYSPQELAEKLTMLGLEVELVVPIKPVFSGIIVGKILEIKKHPNADKLLLCKVTTGKESLSIVCGAHNIKTGDLVPVATIGSVLSNGTKITKRAIKGIESNGMLCSEQELGLTDYISGIFILSSENINTKLPELGTKLQNCLALEDTIFDISITPNRGDALSVIGLVREIGALVKKPIKRQKISFPQKGEPTNKLVKVNVRNKQLCPRYTARIITGIEIKPSPFWLRYRLGLVGTRAINNIVDITNYVLLEQGQPLHAFDYQLIKGNTINIRQANNKEKIITIDNETRTLDKDVLVITDKEKPIALAGVMGGNNTEVTEKTTDILIESALFNPANIRRTSKKFSLTSESSYRFERGVDPNLAPLASNRATQLILEVAGGCSSHGLIDCVKNLPKPSAINLNTSYCNKILGISITPQKIYSIIKSIGCTISKKGKESFSIKPPSYRQDVKTPIDLIEEIARLFGYIKIPFCMPEAKVLTYKKQQLHELITATKRLLTGIGLDEIITYSFIDPNDLNRLGFKESQYICLKNPVSTQTSVMRTTLMPGIINTMVNNINRGNTSLSIFEIGKCFFSNFKNNSPKENIYLSLGLTGNLKGAHWKKKEEEVNFFYLKGIIETIMEKLFIKDYKFLDTNKPILHPKRACSIIINDKEIGFFGELHPALAKNYDLPKRNYIAEINITDLVNLKGLVRKFEPLPKFPGVRRDISIIVDKDIVSYDIIKMIRETGIRQIESINLFDLYKGDPIPKNKISLAYAINFRHKERTLTDKEVDKAYNIIRQKILSELPGVQIRE